MYFALYIMYYVLFFMYCLLLCVYILYINLVFSMDSALLGIIDIYSVFCIIMFVYYALCVL